jgi:DNA-binding NtrC family response regulator
MAKRVLVIDDEMVVREAFEFALDDYDCEVVTASGGEEGIALAQNTPVSLVFLDLNMPHMNGIETLRRLQRVIPDVPVYIVTAFLKEFLPQLKQAADEGLVYELAQKPLNSQQIKEIVTAYLEGGNGDV